MSYGIIVINLDRSSERLTSMRAQFEARNLAFYRLAATDAGTLVENDIRRFYSTDLNRIRYHKRLARGEIACYISHVRAWQHLLSSEWAYAIVLEDDVELDERFGAAIAQIERLECDWDVIKLGAFSPKRIVRDMVHCGPFHLCAYAKIPTCTHAQAISRRGAEKLLTHAIPFGRPVDIDIQYAWEKNLIVYGLAPYCVRASDKMESEIWKLDSRKSLPKSRLRFFLNTMRFGWHNLRYNMRLHGPSRTLQALFFPNRPRL